MGVNSRYLARQKSRSPNYAIHTFYNSAYTVETHAGSFDFELFLAIVIPLKRLGSGFFPTGWES